MADHADDGGGDDIFVYRGGRAPQHITHVVIDKSVDVIEKHAFDNCVNLANVETHDGITKVGLGAFYECTSLKRIDLKFVVEIDKAAFFGCENLEFVEGDKLEWVAKGAFGDCSSLRRLKLPSIRWIGTGAFYDCRALMDIELSERLDYIGMSGFDDCRRLQRIAIPPKRHLFMFDVSRQKYTQFDNCFQLVTVDLVGGMHKTVASLQMDCWRIEMISEIDRINQVLSTTTRIEKTEEIRQWMESVMDKMDHYKAEHYRYLKEAITLLELALWKAKLGEKEENYAEGKTKKAKIDTESARKEKRITSGADIVIKNVLPFLQFG